MSPGPVAVVDCGTNTTRLLITDGRGPAAERRSEITRLGRGVDASGHLEAAAVERTLACLRDYREAIDRHNPSAVRVIATSAVRDAANRSEFLEPAESILEAAPEVLSGREEADMSFRGAVSELDQFDGPFLVVDIGGGSTELSYGVRHCTDALSLDIGSVRLTEKYVHHDPPRPEELSACLSVTELHLDDAVRAIPALSGECRLVGVAGTITTVAAVELGLATYDRDRVHHFRLSKEAAEDVFRTLATEALADRVHNPGLHPGRADVIVAGTCILVRIMRYFDFDECLVSEADLLDGLALSLLEA
ncbi:MAG: Ppx/GppA family phosphatase [Acidimicrobiaceae bacterium]|nr:Ppx/GppA family phosphatase [Acidimicrobiaceae bacterium]MXZ66178.1 Ppx/GppA family phosphatase [Acidimicrobiaceae bacterium]MYF32687.1 Ppx/GppA family phosphatase [Acidimicrobiaceae bacterium]MYG79660.1 Ppx/GppA family phosphatase [Acidimicrobiaceae bacterium]MYJ83005.1 Ppx/GppA family phosphatase [Acidimicrobiaceae bacterium]